MGLLVVVIQDERFHYDYVLESGWGLLYLVLVTVPLVRLAVRPGSPVALAQLGLVTLVVLIGAVWGGSWAQGWNGLALAVTAGLLTWLGPRQRLRWGRVDLPLSFLALLGLPAVVAYGAPLVGNTSDDEVTNGVSHYPMQASLALALVALAALAAVTSSRLPAWTAAFCGCWLGLESIVYPRRRGEPRYRRGSLHRRLERAAARRGNEPPAPPKRRARGSRVHVKSVVLRSSSCPRHLFG